MSFGIYWKPVVTTLGNPLPDGLKYALADRYLGSSSLRGADVFFTSRHLDYLRGLLDGATLDEIREGAGALIKAIERHGTVHVWIGNEDD